MCFSGCWSKTPQAELTVVTALNVASSRDSFLPLEVQVTASSPVSMQLDSWTSAPQAILSASTLECVKQAGILSVLLSIGGIDLWKETHQLSLDANTTRTIELSLVDASAHTRGAVTYTASDTDNAVDASTGDYPRPYVGATIRLAVACASLEGFISQLEHSLQVSCLVSPAVIYAIRLTSKFGDVDAFDRYYAAKAGTSSVSPDPKRIQCFTYTQQLLGAEDTETTSLELADEGARIDICVALNCKQGFISPSMFQVAVFTNGLHDVSLSSGAPARAQLELFVPGVTIPKQGSDVGPFGACVTVSPLAGLDNLLLLLNLHTVKGRVAPQLIAVHAAVKLAIDRLLKSLQRRHTDIFVPKRVLQARAVIPQVAAAMTAIIARSTNRVFQEECMRLLELKAGADMQARLSVLLENSLRRPNTDGELFPDGSVPDASNSDEEDAEE